MAQANPQQKKIYDTIVRQALRFIFEDKVSKRIVDEAQTDPVSAMVNITLTVLKQIKTAASQGGAQMAGDPMFMVPAAKEIMGHILEMLVSLKIVPQQQAAQVFQQAQDQVKEIMQGGGQPQPQQAPQKAGGMLAQGV